MARAPRPAAAAARGGGERGGRRRKGTARRSPSPYRRVVYPPHRDAEQRIAGPKELHFLRDEVLLLGLGLARRDGGPQVGGRHGRRLCPLHRRAPRPGTRPLHAGPGRQPHPPSAAAPGPPCPRTPAGALVPRSPRCPLGRAGEEGCARLAPRLGSRARPPAAPRSARGWTRRAANALPRWAPAS